LLVVFLFVCFLTACFWRNKEAYVIAITTNNDDDDDDGYSS